MAETPLPVEIIKVACSRCGDELATTRLSDEVAACSCGMTFLDHGTVHLVVDAALRVSDD